ncbi:potassium channel [Plasmodium sp. DRC-Itaito]|nr:potassium channel [Plasmodium sp. DRC-Itaito]
MKSGLFSMNDIFFLVNSIFKYFLIVLNGSHLLKLLYSSKENIHIIEGLLCIITGVTLKLSLIYIYCTYFMNIYIIKDYRRKNVLNIFNVNDNYKRNGNIVESDDFEYRKLIKKFFFKKVYYSIKKKHKRIELYMLKIYNSNFNYYFCNIRDMCYTIIWYISLYYWRRDTYNMIWGFNKIPTYIYNMLLILLSTSYIDLVMVIISYNKSKYYLMKSKLLIDIFFSAPCTYLFSKFIFVFEHQIDIYFMMGFLRNIKIFLNVSYVRIEHNSILTNTEIKIIRIVLGVLLLCNAFASTIYTIQAIHPYNLDNGNFNYFLNSYLDYFYFSIISISTVGYGDIFPINKLSKVVCIIFIFWTFIWVPIQFNDLIISIFSKKKTYGKISMNNQKFVLLIGDVEPQQLNVFLFESVAQGNKLKFHLLTTYPINIYDEQIKIADHFCISLYIKNFDLNEKENINLLYSINAQNAYYLFLFSNKFHNGHYNIDTKSFTRLLILKKFLHGKKNAVIELRSNCVSNIVRSIGCENFIIVNLKHSLIVKNIKYPGFITLILNLFTAYNYDISSYNFNDIASYPSLKYIGEFNRGSRTKIFSFIVHKNMVGLIFDKLFYKLYESLGIILVGIETNTTNYYINNKKRKNKHSYVDDNFTRMRKNKIRDKKKKSFKFIYLHLLKKYGHTNPYAQKKKKYDNIINHHGNKSKMEYSTQLRHNNNTIQIYDEYNTIETYQNYLNYESINNNLINIYNSDEQKKKYNDASPTNNILKNYENGKLHIENSGNFYNNINNNNNIVKSKKKGSENKKDEIINVCININSDIKKKSNNNKNNNNNNNNINDHYNYNIYNNSNSNLKCRCIPRSQKKNIAQNVNNVTNDKDNKISVKRIKTHLQDDNTIDDKKELKCYLNLLGKNYAIRDSDKCVVIANSRKVIKYLSKAKSLFWIFEIKSKKKDNISYDLKSVIKTKQTFNKYFTTNIKKKLPTTSIQNNIYVNKNAHIIAMNYHDLFNTYRISRIFTKKNYNYKRKNSRKKHLFRNLNGEFNETNLYHHCNHTNNIKTTDNKNMEELDKLYFSTKLNSKSNTNIRNNNNNNNNNKEYYDDEIKTYYFNLTEKNSNILLNYKKQLKKKNYINACYSVNKSDESISKIKNNNSDNNNINSNNININSNNINNNNNNNNNNNTKLNHTLKNRITFSYMEACENYFPTENRNNKLLLIINCTCNIIQLIKMFNNKYKYNVIILTDEIPTMNIMDLFKYNVVFIKCKILDDYNLINSGLMNAEYILILPTEAKNINEINEIDMNTIIVTRKITHLLKKKKRTYYINNIITELINPSNVIFLEENKMIKLKDKKSSYDDFFPYVNSSQFYSSNIICETMLYNFMTHHKSFTDFSVCTNTLECLIKFLRIIYICDLSKYYDFSFKKIKTFRDLFYFLSKKNIITIGLYRKGDKKVPFYIYTKPNENCLLRFDDIVYIL